MFANKIDSCSLTGTIFDNKEGNIKDNDWIISSITYFMVDVKHSVSKDGLRFENFKTSIQ